MTGIMHFGSDIVFRNFADGDTAGTTGVARKNVDVLPVIEGYVRVACGIRDELLIGPARGRADLALARQVAMYLCHVVSGMTLTDIGRRFGRDRTTAAHACRLIEDRRDNPEFDRLITMLEEAVQGGLKVLGIDQPKGEGRL